MKYTATVGIASITTETVEALSLIRLQNLLLSENRNVCSVSSQYRGERIKHIANIGMVSVEYRMNKAANAARMVRTSPKKIRAIKKMTANKTAFPPDIS